MKSILLVVAALAGLMEAAEEATSSGGTAAEAKPPEAPNIADTSGDTAGQPAGAHLDAPAAESDKPIDPVVIDPGKTVALVTKGCDKIPVQLRDEAHLDTLRSEHGAGNVEVQS